MRGRHYGSNWAANAVSHPMFRDFREHNEVFSDMFCRFPNSASLSFGQQAERVSVELVSRTYFSALGIVPAMGRLLTPADDVVPAATLTPYSTIALENAVRRRSPNRRQKL